MIRASCRIIGEPYRAFAIRFWLGFLAVAATALATAWMIHHWLPGPLFLRWAAMGLATSTVSALCGVAVWLTAEDRRLLLPKLRPVLAGYGINL